MPQFGGASEKCNVCSKTVYLAEKIVVEDKEDRKTFHKNCLKCSHCKVVLTLGNYASMQGIFYCKPHFKQLFATKGNYDEGFGKDKHTKNWTPQPLSAPATFVPVDKDEGGSSAAAGSKKETPSNITSKFGRTTLNTEKCHVCNKTVYATEKIVVEEKEGKKVFHKTCLKCSHCNVIVTLGNYASMQGVVYCKPHFKQLFAAKGNYDEGFGKEKASSKWEPQASAAPATFVPVDKDDGPKEKRATPENVASRFKGASNTEKCTGCGKTVYATERIVVEDKEDRQTFHKSCLRCSHCQVVLTLGNYASLQGVMYCKPHFRQLFAAKGNYDEGFGKEKHTKKWADRDSENGSIPDEHQKDRERELEQETGTEREKEGREKEEREEADREEAKKRREEQEKLEHEEREQEEKEEREREQQELEERKRLEREEEEKEREQSKQEESHDHGESHDHKEHDHDHGESHDHKEHDHDHGVSHDHKEHDHEESHAHKESHDHGESHTHEPHVHEEPKEEQKEEDQKEEEKEDLKEKLSHDHDLHDHEEAKESSEPAEKDDTENEKSDE